MRKLKFNIISNFMGSAWLGALTLAVTPIQIYFLGVEAFGFIGLIAMLQVLLSAFDLGISGTITKVISADHSKNHRESSSVINTASSIYWLLAIIVTSLVWVNGEKIISFFLSKSKLELTIAFLGIKIIAIYLGLRWPIAFYTGVLSGLQRLDILNLLKSVVTTLRQIGGVIVLILDPSLITFLLWFACSSIFELLIYAIITFYYFPGLHYWPYFSLKSFKNIWRYSVSLNFITLASLVSSQADRVVIAKILGLEALGHYSIAYTASSVISLIQSAINSASFPAFSKSFSGGYYGDLLSQYNKTSELMCLVVTAPCFLLIFFSKDILSIWINEDLGNQMSTPMTWLAIGFFLNAIVSSAYIISLACNKPGIPLKVSLEGLLLYIPALVFLVNAYGVKGAAFAYAGLNIFYLIVFIPAVNGGIINQKVQSWLIGTVAPFIFSGFIAFGCAKILSVFLSSYWEVLILILSALIIYILLAWHFISPGLRGDIYSLYRMMPWYKDG